MLIFLCWVFILINPLRFAYSSSPLLPDPTAAALSKAACLFHEQDLLTFIEQPFSVCLPASEKYFARCSASRLKSGNVGVRWTVLEDDQPYSSVTVDANGSLSLICVNRQRGCKFKVWCDLVDNSTNSEVKSHQAPSIRSRTAIVSIGDKVPCESPDSSLTQQPEPRARIVKVQQLTNITLPCLTFLPGNNGHSQYSAYYFSTSWYHNGRPVFAESAFFEADGTYSLERQRRDDFFLWSNLTIYQVQEHHSGYYQCFIGSEDQHRQHFNVIYLDVTPNAATDASLTLSSPVIDGVSYPTFREIRVRFRKSELSFRKGEFTSELTSRAISFATLNYTIGVVRQRKLNTSSISSPDYMDCLTGSDVPGAETSFSGPRLASVNDGLADFELPPHFFADSASCRDLYMYAVFVKYFSDRLNIASVSPLYPLSYDRRPDRFSLAVDEAKSGVYYACTSSRREAALLTSLQSNRVMPVTPLKRPETILLESFCTCDWRSSEAMNTDRVTTTVPTVQVASQNTSFLTRISLSYVPFPTGGLIPNTSYCISSDTDCVTYVVPGFLRTTDSDFPYAKQLQQQARPLSYERLPDDTIAVSWSLAHCYKQLSKQYRWSIQLSYQGERTRIPTTDCSGRALFQNLTNFRARHDISLSYDDDIDLSVLAVPAMLAIDNLAAFVVTRSRIILAWTSLGFLDDPPENRRVTEVGYSVYACLPSTPLPDNGLTDKKVLECLGCRFVCRVSTYSVTVNDAVHAELTGYDEHVTDFQFVVWADVSLLVDPGQDYDTMEDYDSAQVHEMVPVGIVGQINISLVDAEIDGRRPHKVSLFANLTSSPTPDWNVTWLAPSFPQDYGLTLISYTVHVVPISRHLNEYSDHHDDNYYNILVRIVPPDQQALVVPNGTNELLAESAEKCPRLFPEAYVVQVVPVWAWEYRHKWGNISSFIIDGAPSAPFVFRTKIDRTTDDDTERLSRLQERALSYQDLIKSLHGESDQGTSNEVHLLKSSGSNNNSEGGGLGSFMSRLLPIPIVIACVAFLGILFFAMFFVYRCQVRRHAAKCHNRAFSYSAEQQETRAFVTSLAATPTLYAQPAESPLLLSSMNSAGA